MQSRFLPRTVLVAVLGSTLLSLNAADWPQYRGPQGNGVAAETISAQLPKGGPKQLWEVQTPGGFSSFAVQGGKAYTLVLRDQQGAERETLVAYDANSGKELWSSSLGAVKTGNGGQDGTPDNKGGDGPRSTPAVRDGKVYVNSAKLVLSCFDANSGKLLWQNDLVKDYAGRIINWDNAASPVIDGNLVFVAGGGKGQSLLAFDKETGKLAWKGEDDQMTHATPVAASIHGQRQIIFFTQSGLVSVVPESGKVLWRQPFKYNVSTAASPVVADDIVYCAAGYGVGAGAYKISKQGNEFKSTQLWRSEGNEPVANHWSTPVYKDGHLYGMFSFKKYGTGPLKCVELATGKVKWTEPNFGAGNVILAGNTVIALADNGELVVVAANPEKYTELSRSKVVDGKCWSTPALANGKIYIRSTKEGACLDLGSNSRVAAR
jgi:outer membrane protein assembly factor BamB